MKRTDLYKGQSAKAISLRFASFLFLLYKEKWHFWRPGFPVNHISTMDSSQSVMDKQVLLFFQSSTATE